MRAPLVSLPGTSFESVFPFHIALDRSMRVVQMGAALRRVCPALEDGLPIGQAFRFERPAVEVDFEAIKAQARSVFLLEGIGHPLKLKGQMLHVDESDLLLFLGSPWITNMEALGQLGISLDDFAIHDQVVDCLFLLQTQSAALADVRKLASKQSVKLGQQREALLEAEKKMRERLEKELQVAKDIQVGILPRKLEVEGLEVAAEMVTATEVGGDYFDVLPVKGGAWIGIGDVSGHGVNSGLVMLMVQGIVSTLVAHGGELTPREAVVLINRVLFENIRHRMKKDDFVTFSLLRYETSGRLTFAGAHEHMLICRAATGRCEEIETPGVWLGVMPEVGAHTVDTSVQLEDGDLVVLYTDGVTEGMSASREQFGIERLAAAVEEVREKSVAEIRAHALAALMKWMPVQEDDATILMFRYRRPGGRG